MTDNNKDERPRRVVISKNEALKRMKEFFKRKQKFVATVQEGKKRCSRA